MEGRILFYNPNTGQGKLILKSEEKMEFSADQWNDFEEIPAAGGLVSCVIEGGILKSLKSIDAKELFDTFFDKTQEDQETDEALIRPPKESIKDGKHKPTFSVEETIQNYFQPITTLIGKPPEVLNTTAQMDYFLVKRFLMTAYNDLKGLDASLHNNVEIKTTLENITQLQKAYKNVEDRLDTPKLAFEMIFLRSQPEYLHFIRYKEHCLNRTSILTQIEESLFPDIKEKEAELKQLPKDAYQIRDALEKELKKMRRHYVDSIHEKAEIYEELSSMADLKSVYIEQYAEKFFTELLKVGGKHLEVLKSILNYRAYDLDKLMWEHAEKSKMIREFLSNANIEGDYSTLTFLRYYLKTLDPEKLRSKQKELFQLEAYLEARQ